MEIQWKTFQKKNFWCDQLTLFGNADTLIGAVELPGDSGDQ